MHVAKRTSFLGEMDALADFYNHEKVIDRYESNLLSWYKNWKEMTSPEHDVTIAVYGELFGGHYPHKEVEVINGVKGVRAFFFSLFIW